MTVNISSKFRKSNDIVNHRDFDKFEKRIKGELVKARVATSSTQALDPTLKKPFFLTFV